MKETNITFTLSYNYGSLKARRDYGGGDIEYTIDDILSELEGVCDERDELQDQVNKLEKKIEEMEKVENDRTNN